MGVHGLWQLLSSTGKPVPLESLEGKVLAVDVSVWLHQLSKGMRDGSGNPVQNAHLHGLFTRICKLLYYRIKPVFVFDGGVPILKKQTLASRRNKREEAERTSSLMQQKILTNLIRRQALKEACGLDSLPNEPPVKSSTKGGKDVMFELPPLPETSKSYLSQNDAEDDTYEERRELQEMVEDQYEDLSSIDVESEEFKALPADIQHEIITDIRLTRKNYNLSRIADLPDDSKDFSSFQMAKLVKHNRLNTRLDQLRKELNERQTRKITNYYGDRFKDTSDIYSQRNVSDDSSHYILAKRNLQKRQVSQEVDKITTQFETVEEQSEDIQEVDELLIESEDECGTVDVLEESRLIFEELRETGDSDNEIDKNDTVNIVSAETSENGADVEQGNRKRRSGNIVSDKSRDIRVKGNTGICVATKIVRKKLEDEKPRFRAVVEVEYGSDSESSSDFSDSFKDRSDKSCSEMRIPTVNIGDEPLMIADSQDSQDDPELQIAIEQSLQEQSVNRKSKDIRKDCEQTRNVVKADDESVSNLRNFDKNESTSSKDYSSCDSNVIVYDISSELTSDSLKDSLSEADLETQEYKINSNCTKSREFVSKLKDKESQNAKAEGSENNSGSFRRSGVLKRKITNLSDDSRSSEEAARKVIRVDSDDSEKSAQGEESDDDFIEVKVDLSKLKEDELFPASMFETPPDRRGLESQKDAGDSEVQKRQKPHETHRNRENLSVPKIAESLKEKSTPPDQTDETKTWKVGRRSRRESLEMEGIDMKSTIKAAQQVNNSASSGSKLSDDSVTLDTKHNSQCSFPTETDDSGSLVIRTTIDDVETSDEKNSNEAQEVLQVAENSFVDAEGIENEIDIEINDKTPEKVEKLDRPQVISPVTEDLATQFKVSITEQRVKDLSSILASEGRELRLEQGRQERLAVSITDQMHVEAQELLQLFGIPFIVSPTEAEAQCAQLELIRLTNGTITDDSDIWLFGGRCVYKNFFNQQKHVECFREVNISSQLGLTREGMINIAMLCGSDYTEGIRGVGPVTAMEIMAKFPGRGTEGLTKFKTWWEQSQRQIRRPVKESKLLTKLRDVDVHPGFPSSQVVEAYLHPTVDDSAEKFSWSVPDVDQLREFARNKLNWNRTKADEVLMPVMKRLTEKQTQRSIAAFFQPETYMRPAAMKSKRLQKVVEKFIYPEAEDSDESDGEIEEITETSEKPKARKKGQGQKRGLKTKGQKQTDSEEQIEDQSQNKDQIGVETNDGNKIVSETLEEEEEMKKMVESKKIKGTSVQKSGKGRKRKNEERVQRPKKEEKKGSSKRQRKGQDSNESEKLVSEVTEDSQSLDSETFNADLIIEQRRRLARLKELQNESTNITPSLVRVSQVEKGKTGDEIINEGAFLESGMMEVASKQRCSGKSAKKSVGRAEESVEAAEIEQKTKQTEKNRLKTCSQSRNKPFQRTKQTSQIYANKDLDVDSVSEDSVSDDSESDSANSDEDVGDESDSNDAGYPVVKSSLNIDEILHLKMDCKMTELGKTKSEPNASRQSDKVFENVVSVNEILHLDSGTDGLISECDTLESDKNIAGDLKKVSSDQKAGKIESGLANNHDSFDDDFDVEDIDYFAKEGGFIRDTNYIDKNDWLGVVDVEDKDQAEHKNENVSKLLGKNIKKELDSSGFVNTDIKTELIDTPEQEDFESTEGTSVVQQVKLEQKGSEKSKESRGNKSLTVLNLKKKCENEPVEVSQTEFDTGTRTRKSAKAVKSIYASDPIKPVVTGLPWADKRKGRKKGVGSQRTVSKKTVPQEKVVKKDKGKGNKAGYGVVNLSESDSDD